MRRQTADEGHRSVGSLGVRRLIVALSGAGLALVTGGCGSSVSDTPPSASHGATSQASDMAVHLRLAEADPCRILIQAASRLGVGSGNLVSSPSALRGQACRLTNFPDKPDTTPGKTYLVQLMDSPGTFAHDSAATPPIAGFPAQHGTPSGATSDNTCAEIVNLTPDVPAAQTDAEHPRPVRYLWVQYSNLARDNPTLNHQAACDTATEAAATAINSLAQASG